MATFNVEYKDASPSRQIEADDLFDARDLLVEELNKAKETHGYSGGVMGPYSDDTARAALIFSPDFKILAVVKEV